MLTQIHKEQRRGKATSSEFHKLMGKQGLNQMGDTYALEKAIEIVFGVDEDEGYESYDMQLGTEREPLAFDFFKEKMELEFHTVKLGSFIALGENTGGTPDAEVDDLYPVETKCPKPENYFKILRYGLDAVDPNWLIQLQHQMWIKGADRGYFNPFTIYNGNPFHHYYEVKRDLSITDKMQNRLEEWVKLRDNHVEILHKKLTEKQC